MSDTGQQNGWDKYPAALPQGTVLAGQYVIEDVLGEGGFGITYLAREHKTNEKVAIKEFFPASMVMRQTGNPQVTAYTGENQDNFTYGMQQFKKEAEVLAQFQDTPNIVGVRSYFEENGTAYFVMDYIKGINFKTYIQNRGGKISWPETLGIMKPVMEALAVVHRKNVIHRDVTPDNIIISDQNTVKLLDFGAARYSLGDKSRSLDVVLKAGYAPKEQYTRKGRQGAYTDVYSVAACFYAALSGFLPPEAPERMDDDDLILLSSRGVALPRNAEDAILKGLEVRAEDRFQSMDEFLWAIESAEDIPQSPDDSVDIIDNITDFPDDGQPSDNRSDSPKLPLKKLLIGLAGAAVLLAVIVIIVFQRNSSPAVNTEPSSRASYKPEDVTKIDTSNANGEIYDGETKNGIRDGYGTCTYPNGDSYKGEWKNGKKEGQGLYIWANGDEYEGEWKNDEMVIQ